MVALASVETLYRTPLGEILAHYDNIYKIEKGLVWGRRIFQHAVYKISVVHSILDMESLDNKINTS